MSDTDEFSPEKAAEVMEYLPDDISALVLALAQEKLRALQISGVALDQRCTQAAAFQLAAAALDATLLAAEKTSVDLRFLSAASCAAFVTGAIIAFGGVRSGTQHLPGVEPSWWHKALENKPFKMGTARVWLASYYEEAIRHNCAVDARRATALNLSLIAGGVGAAFVVLAALARYFDGLH